MTLIRCPECSAMGSDKAAACPQCGYPRATGSPPRQSGQPSTGRRRKNRLPRWVFLAVGLCFAIGIVAAAINRWVFPNVPGVSSPAATPLPADELGERKATPALDRVHAARQLQERFDASVVANWHLQFFVRGPACDVLQVEAENVDLAREMMQAVGYGTVLYGQIVPGGVNAFAFDRGFKNVIFTNTKDRVAVAFGTPTITAGQAKRARLCTKAIAEGVGAPEGKAPAYSQPAFEQLSWANAKKGAQIFDASYALVGTIADVDRDQGIIAVHFTTGQTEPKLLDAVAKVWYVRR